MPPTDAPHIAYREFFQRLHTLLLRIDDIEPLPGFVRLGKLVGGLGQYFRRGDAQTNRDTDSSPGGADDLAPQFLEIEAFHSRKVEEGFVDAVNFEVGDEGGPNAVHAVAHVAVLWKENRYVEYLHQLIVCKIYGANLFSIINWVFSTFCINEQWSYTGIFISTGV